MVRAERRSALEQQLLDEISQDRLWTYVSTVAKDERMSGSAEEREAMQYIAGMLRSWNVDVHEYEHDGYVSKPLSARLNVHSPESAAIECSTSAFGTSGTVRGEVVFVDQGNDDDYGGKDVAGKVVLINAIASPGRVLTAGHNGAAAAIFTSHNHLYQRIVTPVWGTPTPDRTALIPQIPVISIYNPDSERIRVWLEQGAVEVELEAEVCTGWATLPIVVGDIHGAQEADRFVMLAGHVDSWFYGAMDNAAANATTLECMRILAAHRDQLRRGFRAVFWSGHSHGRYAGSTWYADNFWEELSDGCVAYVNVDSTGATGAVLYEEILAMSETAQLAKDVISDVAGQTAEVNRIGRAGDQSFWGIGIPSVFMSLSRVPIESAPELSKAMGTLMGRKKSGQAWFWHTEHDTLDKIDRNVLELDTKIYLSTILRLCNNAVLPFDYAATVTEIAQTLGQYQSRAGQALDLSRVIARAEELHAQIETLNARIGSVQGEAQEASANQALIDLGRLLVPVNYTETGKFDHDLAMPSTAVPGLRGVDELARLEPESDGYRFLRTQLRRRQNQLAFTLRQAQARVRQALSELGGGEVV
jgi:Iap family predicted aminopeptidase